jgi:phage FluMu protein Com
MPNPTEIRCPECNRKVAEALGATNISCVCPRCKTSFDFNNTKKDKVMIEAKIEK